MSTGRLKAEPQVVEQEPNNSSATAENLDPYFLEMTLDMVSGGDFAVGDRPQDIETGDFNGDNRMDLLVANQGDTRVSSCLAMATARFKPQVTGTSRPLPGSLNL